MKVSRVYRAGLKLAQGLEVLDNFSDHGLCIAVEHPAVIGIEQGILDAGIPGALTAFHHDDVLRHIGIQNRHAVYRAGFIGACHRIHHIVGTNNECYIALWELAIDFFQVEDLVIRNTRFRQKHVHMTRHTSSHRMDGELDLDPRFFKQGSHLPDLVLGVGNGRIMWRHMLPTLTTYVIVTTSLAIPSFILLESGLSFLGIGVQPPTPSWGSMIQQARENMNSHPMQLFWPCLVLSMTIFALNFVGSLAIALMPSYATAIGGLFVIETASVIAQVIAFRGFGRRVFRMSPIHHHFELLGWPEFTVIVRFWIIGGILVAIGIGLFYTDFIARGGLG